MNSRLTKLEKEFLHNELIEKQKQVDRDKILVYESASRCGKSWLYGMIDLHGDVLMPGCFNVEKTIDVDHEVVEPKRLMQ